MAIRAFILIETDVGKNKEVVSNLKQLECVESVDSVTGPYDVIATIEAKDTIEIGDFVVRMIKSIRHITRSVACIGKDAANSLVEGIVK